MHPLDCLSNRLVFGPIPVRNRALVQAKLAEIDARMAELALARAVIECGMQCTCPSIDGCTCGVHTTTAREPIRFAKAHR